MRRFAIEAPIRYTVTMNTPLLTPEQLLADLADLLVIVDCRFQLGDAEAGRRAYAAGHIPGAVYADLERDLSSPVVPGSGRHPLPDPTTLANKLRAWGVSRDSLVVCYDDQSGAIAARLWWLLRWLGHERAAVLDGGYRAWLDLGGEPSSAVPAPEPGDFEPHPVSELIVSADELARRLHDPAYRVLDARAKERFRGDVESIDRVAGHIPGALSVPFADNLAHGRMKSPAELRERFAAVIGETPPERVVVYCGSGVTACHDILAAEHAGLGLWRLYPGSYSEWIADGQRPVATGD